MSPDPRQAGMVTAELAVAMPAVIFALVISVSAIDVVIDQVRCVDAARVGARLLARGESEEVVRAQVGRSAPDQATITVNRSAREVMVEVRSPPPTVLRLVGVSNGPAARADGLVEAGLGGTSP